MASEDFNPTRQYLDSLSPSVKGYAIAGLRTILEILTGSRRRYDVTQFAWHELSDSQVKLLLDLLITDPPRRRYGKTMLLQAGRTLRRIRQIAAESAQNEPKTP